MNYPLKIIHKFKNNNRRIQYKIYIFIGSLVPKNVKSVLDIIDNQDFYTMLSTIKKSNYEIVEEYYGEFWYEYFYTSYHLNSQIKLITSTKQKSSLITDKFKIEWYNKHIMNAKNKSAPYSFSGEYYEYLLSRNKIKNVNKKPDVDYRTYDLDKHLSMQYGGEDSDTDIDTDINTDIDTDNDTDIESIPIANKEINDDVINEPIDDEILEEEINLDDITKLYATNDNEESKKSIDETTQLISDALNNKSWNKESNTLSKIYDDKYDNAVYDNNLSDIYDKYYITDQYIFRDNTIKIIKNKIAASVPLSDSFGKSIRLMPETQYLWTEYNYNNNKDYVMLGQKWVTRTELLKIDIKPNENIKIYEKLKNNLSYLKDNIGFKIKREDDEDKTLNFYENYIPMHEIFLIDIYNDLGLNYNVSSDEKQNLYQVYINIYYPHISSERTDIILDLLNGKNTNELTYIDSHFKILVNELRLQTEIETTVTKLKVKAKSNNKLFSDNHIIQSNVHVNLINPKNITGTNMETKFDLYRIFDNFIVNEEYPFIQYQTPDSKLVYKFIDIDKDIKPYFMKWFENAPYGITFKIKTNVKEGTGKYLSVGLHDTGKLEYKVTWTEDDNATMDDVKETYVYIKELLNKINVENKKIKIIPPEDNKYKYAFINTIQQFTLPEKFIINHNNLSDFCRYFYPYISLVIEPRKRKSKKEVTETVSKYGTYIRYKRIDDYENKRKMHMRILYYLKYFDLGDMEIINEIAKQYNITNENASYEIDHIKNKYSKYIKKSGSHLKKALAMPKTKPPGIGIDIQGRDREKYKIRITGVRNKNQLDEIVDFLKVLIYLYIEIYLYKNKDYQSLRDTLKSLTNIAKRRNQVADVVDYNEEKSNVKSLISLDKSRLGFKPEKGQHQWTRSCQNSGTDKKRRPEPIPESQINKLIKDGYKMNPKSGLYEKNVELNIRGKKFKTTLKALKLQGDNNTFNYYTCDPSQNKEHVYIGFLSKGNNPNDLCMPCCFIKDPSLTVNKKKSAYFNQCLGQKAKEEKTEIISTKKVDKIYILQETNKVHDGRYINLPKYLDIFFNKIWKHDNKIKNHYLIESNSGYYFKYTIKNEVYFFLAAISHVYNKSIDDIIKAMITFIENDKKDLYFTYLNNGMIKSVFQTRENYIKYLKTSTYLEYDIVGELLSIPNVLSPKGVNYFIINKKDTTRKSQFDKESISSQYYVDCLNIENNYLLNKPRDLLIIIKEDKYYFPIYFIQKSSKESLFNITKIYNTDKPYTNIINELTDYFHTSCSNYVMNNIVSNNNLIVKNIINKLGLENVVKQYIDDKNKCKYIELKSGLLLPVKPSGIMYELPIAHVQNIKYTNDIDTTIKQLVGINKILNLEYKPKMILYDKLDNKEYSVVALSLYNGLIINIKKQLINDRKLKNYGIPISFSSLNENIDNAIIQDEHNIYDNRKENVNKNNYLNESYNLYRLELSHYLTSNPKIKEQITKIATSTTIGKIDRKHELRKILLGIIDNKLAPDYKVTNNLAFIVNKIPNLKEYVISNTRDICKINKTETKCNKNLHCLWKNGSCKLQIYDTLIYDFINRIIEELIQNNIKYKEIMEDGEYYVSDIIDVHMYSTRNSQKILKATNFNVQKLLGELFETNNIPILGKRQIAKRKANLEDINLGKELNNIGNQYTQEIITNTDSIIRAYVNSYYWVNNKLYDTESRNLGYFNDLQTKLTYILKAHIIDYIQNNLFKTNDANSNFFSSYINKFRKLSVNTDGKMELSVLSKIINIPIIVYDNYMNVKYIYSNGEVPVNPESIKNYTSGDSQQNNIHIKFDLTSSTLIPRIIYAIYYI